MFFYTTVLLLIFHNLLYDLRMRAAVCRRGHLNNGRRRGLRCLFVSYGDSHFIVLESACRLSIRVPNAGQPRHLVHHQALCLPSKAGSLKENESQGV
jgi:hypothetical protein